MIGTIVDHEGRLAFQIGHDGPRYVSDLKVRDYEQKVGAQVHKVDGWTLRCFDGRRWFWVDTTGWQLR